MHTMLLGWLGSTTTVDQKNLSPPKKPQSRNSRYVLGVLGTRNRTDYESLQREVIGPMVDAWGLPAQMIIPSESESSHVLVLWAQQKDIPIHMVSSDWSGFGRKASMVRDSYIQQNADCLVFLQGPRSNRVAAVAARLAKKGRAVALSERPGQILNILGHTLKTEQ